MITKLALWNRTKLALSLCVVGSVINISRQYFDWSLWLNPISLLLIMMGLIGCLANIATYKSIDNTTEE